MGKVIYFVTIFSSTIFIRAGLQPIDLRNHFNKMTSFIIKILFEVKYSGISFLPDT